MTSFTIHSSFVYQKVLHEKVNNYIGFKTFICKCSIKIINLTIPVLTKCLLELNHICISYYYRSMIITEKIGLIKYISKN